jgi:hypothetical protein
MITLFENFRREEYPNKKLIIVDIQPSYRIHMNMDMTDFTEWLNHHHDFDILYLYNGPDMGYEDEYEIREWLLEYGLETDENMTFYEKGYGFFRDFMDSDVEDDVMVEIGKYMLKNNLTDHRQIKEEDRKQFDIDEEYFEDWYSFGFTGLEIELESFLNKGDKPLLIGGGQYECFKEVVLMLEMLGYEWDKESQFIY